MRGDVIFEFIPMRRYVKVSAICTASGTEVSIVGDAAASQEQLQQTALKKLEYVLQKR